MKKKPFFTVKDHKLTEDPQFLLNQELPHEHPDSLFGKLRAAQFLLDANRLEEATEILGRNLILKELLPGRQLFHVEEFIEFEKVAIRFLLDSDNDTAASTRLDVLRNNFPTEPGTLLAIDFYYEWLVKKSRQLRKEVMQKMHTAGHGTLSPFWSTLIPGDLQLTITEWLFTEGFSFPPGIIREILNSPGDLLVSDLQNMILEAVIYRDEMHMNSDFLMHGIFFLAEVRAYGSLPLILEVLKLDQELLDHWFGDMLCEVIWEPLYKLSENQLGVMEAFMKQPGISEYSKGAVADAVEQIAYHQPDRRNEVIGWFRRCLEFYRDQEVITDLKDNGTLTFLICSVVDLRAEELWPVCRELFDQQKVELDMTGTLEELEPEMFTEFEDFCIKEILPLEERYPALEEQWNRENYEYEEEDDDEDGYDDYDDYDDWDGEEDDLHDVPYEAHEITPILPTENIPVIAAKKPGRNDPCPCGSGKKYKKCCGSVI